MLLLFRCFLIVAAVAITPGCSARFPSYQLVPTDRGAVLIPPGVEEADLVERRLRLPALSGGGKCPTVQEGVSLRRRRRGVRLAISQEALKLSPNGWLLGWAAPLESNGCLLPGQGLAAARAAAQALPGDGNREFELLYARPRGSSRTDLMPWSRLRVTSPIFRPGAPADAKVIAEDQGNVTETPRGLALTLRASEDFLGYEAAFYNLRPRPGGGARLELEFAETRIGEETTRSETASRYPLVFDEEARYFRMLVLTRVSDKDHDTALLAAATLAELEERTREVEAEAAYCQQLGAAGGCLAVDFQVALLPFVTVRLNDREIAVPPGSTVRRAIGEVGVSVETTLPSLTVERDFIGRLTPVEGDRIALLELRLLGGERIRW